MIKTIGHYIHPETEAMWKILDCRVVWREALEDSGECLLPIYLKEESKN